MGEPAAIINKKYFMYIFQEVYTCLTVLKIWLVSLSVTIFHILASVCYRDESLYHAVSNVPIQLDTTSQPCA